MIQLDQKKDAPLLIVLGQSNAHGHGTHLLPAAYRTVRLASVYDKIGKGAARQNKQATKIMSGRRGVFAFSASG